MRVSLTIAAAVVLVAIGGCREPMGFACASDEQCMTLSGEMGLCFPIGACGYPDAKCSSRYRYSENAPIPWANKCVLPDEDPPPATSGPSTSSTTDEGESSSSSPSSDESSTTGELPMPTCGNAIPEPGELCDDGNSVEADGCNPDCRPSGMQLLSFTSKQEGDDQAEAILLTDENDIIVGGIAGEVDRNGFVARYRADGVEQWRREVVGTDEGSLDAVWGLALSPEGNVRYVGQVINTPADEMDPPRPDYQLAELLPENGNPVWMFEVGGASDAERGYDIATLPNGDFVVAGRVGAPTNSDFGVVRFAIADAGDGEYMIETVWAHAFDGGSDMRDFAEGIAWYEGRIIVGGTMEYEADDLDRHLRALDPDGEPFDPPCEDLGGDDPLVADDAIFGVAVGPSGEVAAVGWATRKETELADAWLGYYPPGECGLLWVRTTEGAGHYPDAYRAVAIDDLGHIVVGGYLNTGNNEDAWLTKYDSASNQLWAIEPIDGPGNGNDRIESIAVGPNREITVGGRMTRPGEDDAWIARYTP